MQFFARHDNAIKIRFRQFDIASATLRLRSDVLQFLIEVPLSPAWFVASACAVLFGATRISLGRLRVVRLSLARLAFGIRTVVFCLVGRIHRAVALGLFALVGAFARLVAALLASVALIVTRTRLLIVLVIGLEARGRLALVIVAFE